MTNDYKKIYQDGQKSVETLPFVFINISLLILVRFCLTLFVFPIGNPQAARFWDRPVRIVPSFSKFCWSWSGPSFSIVSQHWSESVLDFSTFSDPRSLDFFGAGPLLGPGPIYFGQWIPDHHEHSDHYQIHFSFAWLFTRGCSSIH